MTSKIKVDNINKVSDDSNIINKCGTTITLGASGDTIALASGASQTGFGRTGTVDWQTGSIKTSTFTAANGEGYFANTSGGAFTVNLPASPSAGDIVAFADYTRTFGTNNLTINRNSEPIGGVAANALLNVNGQSATFIYVDGTEGWINTNETQTSQTGAIPFMSATGGTITTCGDFKIHTFTGPGTFAVTASTVGSARNSVAYTVVAGGGGGGSNCAGGGGGAGGFREGRCASAVPYTASPLVAPVGITVSTQSYPITVGAGGTAGAHATCTGATNGVNSTFDTITSAGGGRGGGQGTPVNGAAGGSGGGGAHHPGSGGAGNSPSVSPPQGNSGGASNPGSSPSGDDNAGSGGGAASGGASGGDYSNGGGPGVATSITGSSVTRAGGGGGGDRNIPGQSPGIHPGGTGGGGPSGGSSSYPRPDADAAGHAGTANTGGGGGGGVLTSPTGGVRGVGGAGGSGIVIIRYKFQ